MDKFLSVSEVSEYLNVKKTTVYSWVESREIPFYKIGRLIRFKKNDIDEWMEKHRKEILDINKAAKRILKPITMPKRNIDNIVRKAIDEIKDLNYTPNYGRPDQFKGLGKEVEDGTF